jgi:hypothetical protein
VQDLVVNLVASALAGIAVWVGQRLLAHRRLARKRAFFGLAQGAPALLVVARHHDSPHRLSVHRNDVAALVELTAVVRECGAKAELTGADGPPGLGKVTEFCVGGPDTNPRSVAHLRALLPGVRMATYKEAGHHGYVEVGPHRFDRRPGRAEYAVLARVPINAQTVFSILGQISYANLAAVRHLADRHGALLRRYGVAEPFCLVLRVVESDAYGPDLVEVAADVSAYAFGPRGSTGGSTDDTRPGVPRQARLGRVWRRGRTG